MNTASVLDADCQLVANDVTKVYPGTTALDGVTIRFQRGKVNALMGGNGAGKSTLVKILAGAERPTSGTLLLEGELVKFARTRDAADRGIAMIYQELSLCPNLSVTDNIFLGHELRAGLTVDRNTQQQRSVALLERLGEQIDPRTLVGDLRLGQQQLVEIAKALSRDVSVLIMDEPSSALSEPEIDVLLRVTRSLCDEGVTVIYISHNLGEVLKIADWVTVIRDGRVVGDADVPSIDVEWLVQKMVGRSSDLGRTTDSTPGPIALRVSNLTLPHPRIQNNNVVNDVSFEVREGEIVGIFGLLGAGRTELLECLAGRHRNCTGEVVLGDRQVAKLTIRQRIELGLMMIPEDRQRDGLVHNLSVLGNLSLTSIDRYRTHGIVSPSAETAAGEGVAKRLAVRAAGLRQPITELSGGNQQKAIIGRAMLAQPRVLMMDEPTRGVDVGAKAEIFRIMEQLAAQGIGIVFVSSEVHEVAAMSDRIVVMSKGHITRRFDRTDVTEAAMVQAAGAAPATALADLNDEGAPDVDV